MNNYILIGTSVTILVSGIFSSWMIIRWANKKAKQKIKEAEKKAAYKVKQGEYEKREKIASARKHFENLKSSCKKEIRKEKENLEQIKNNINEKKANVEKQVKELNQEKNNLKQQKETLEKIIKRNEELQKKYTTKLEAISNLSKKDATAKLLETLKEKAQKEANIYSQTLMKEVELCVDEKAQKIVIETIQRVGVEHAIENCVSIFNLESDELKGKIIGKEGRNIKALEQVTGVDIIIDDTPSSILISSFDPVRRQIAYMTIETLLKDGRIHPAKIEEVKEKTEKKINQDIIETGKSTVIDLGIVGLHPELIKMVGRMKFRSSYGQNLLQHSKEVANLCGLMAAELKLNPKLAKRAGLLHDIGKISETEIEDPHAIVSMKLCKKYGEKYFVYNAVGAHHDDIEMESLYAPIIQVCDAMSGARPGARKQSLENYINRLKDLEKIALCFDGVENAYVIQAGRELRVIVKSEEINDEEAGMISYEISRKIQNEMTYPGQVKVTVIRETRAVSIAK